MARYTFSREDCAEGGRQRWLADTPEEARQFRTIRQQGGDTRAKQPGFLDHNRRIAPLGAAVTIDRYGLAFLLQIAAEKMRRNPTEPERWLRRELHLLGLREERDFELQWCVRGHGDRSYILDCLMCEVQIDGHTGEWFGVNIEMDGPYHDTAADAERDLVLWQLYRIKVERIAAAPLRTKAGRAEARLQLHYALGLVAFPQRVLPAADDWAA